MAEALRRIIQLPPETQAQIRSTVQIHSICDVVLELVKNSLDADAGSIEVRLDFRKGYCSILDNGRGIPKYEFWERKLGQLYHTSRSIHSTRFYGRYGRYLASLSGVSLLSITSCCASDGTVNSMVLRDGKHIATETNSVDEELGGVRHGTRVVVHNLFGQMPVRVKHRQMRLTNQSEHEKEFLNLKRTLVGLVLAASSPLILDVRETDSKYMHRPHQRPQIPDADFDVPFIASTFSQAGFLDYSDLSSWRRVAAHSTTLSIHAAICLRPAPSKNLQFISLNHRPIPSDISKRLLDQINGVFDASDFGTIESDGSGEDSKLRERKPLRRALGDRQVDRWPIFYIRVILKDDACRIEESTETDADKLVASINGVLHSLATEFLQSNGIEVRKTGTVRRSKRPIAESNIANVPSLSNWTRIKSGNGSPQDLLTGLPFMTPRSRVDASSMQPRQTVSKLSSDEAAFEWTNPRTGNTVQVNSRTGMVLPHKLASMPSTFKPQLRALVDVTNALEQYSPCAHIEEALKSIVPDHESACHFSSNGHVHILGRGMPIQVSGSTSVESEELHITKSDLKTARTLGQVDGKFVLASVVSNEDETILIMIDQHAADERVKFEELLQRFSNSGKTSLLTPITFKVDSQEARQFQHLRAYFAMWEILYSVSEGQIRVSALPELISERCRAEPMLLINLLRTEVWKEHSPSLPKADHWLNQVSAYPQGILRILASRACRSAIMFNDKLSLAQSEVLIRQLSECLFPFQCAHGRPSLTTLARIRDVDNSNEMEMKDSSFGEGWKAWSD